MQDAESEFIEHLKVQALMFIRQWQDENPGEPLPPMIALWLDMQMQIESILREYDEKLE